MIDYLLLIWQIIPEDMELYLIPSSEIDDNFQKIDHKYQNMENSCEVDEALDRVSTWLENNGENYKVSLNEPFRLTKSQHISEVITSGFLL